MTLRTVSPEKARDMLNEGAILVDIREADEHARERISAAQNLPLSKLDQAELELHRGKPVIFHCRSGQRTQMNEAKLKVCAGKDCEAFVVEGGLDGWRKAGLPVVTDRRQPIEMQRQVQIVAGSLGLGGVLLGAFVSPAFFAVRIHRGGPAVRGAHRNLWNGQAAEVRAVESRHTGPGLVTRMLFPT